MLLENGLIGEMSITYLHYLLACCLPFRLAELTPNQRNDPDALKALFDGHQLSNRLLYRVLPEMRSNSYNTQSLLCIFFDGINHYTAIKQHSNNSILLPPYVELLGSY